MSTRNGEERSASRPRFLERLASAGVGLSKVLHTLLTLFHAGLLFAYLGLRASGEGLWWIDVCSYILPWLFAPLVVLLPGALLRRSRALLIPVTISLVLFCGIYGPLYLPRLPVEASGPTFTVMAYNVLSRNPDAERVGDVIEAHNPDVLGLHELEPAMAQALEGRLAAHYPHREVKDDSWCGLFSRYPIVQCEFFWMRQDSSVPRWAEGYWGQRCILDVDGEEVTVFNVHLRIPHLRGEHPFGLPIFVPVEFDKGNHEADLRDLSTRIEQVEGPLVVLGDFNLTDQQRQYEALATHLDDAHRESGWGDGIHTFELPQDRSLPLAR